MGTVTVYYTVAFRFSHDVHRSIEVRIRMYLTGQERRLKKLLFQIVCISFEEF